MTERIEYRCGKHGTYEPDFGRVYDGEVCPRIMCPQCEIESLDPDPAKRPRNISYFVNGEKKVVLVEAHRMSAVWRFDPPVATPEFSFDEHLNPVIPEGALEPEETMARMEELLPEVNRLCAEGGINVPDPRDLLILPGKELSVGRDDESA